jgi:hypothetical protein
MDANNTATGIKVMMVLAALVIFVPVFIGLIRHRSTFMLFSGIFCLFAAALMGAATAGGIFGAAGLGPMAGAAWVSATLCALAAAADGIHEKRHKEMMFRLLNNDAEGLAPPPNLKRKYKDHRP